ncbi:MAG: hypothetical protein QF380_05255, partial [Candidatus Marinimicrobia bacterium]|nr:hypothetical protein [Candidatus Neomarinimicrobiota bacterium]
MIKPTIIASLLLFLPNLSKGEINYSHSGYANATTVNRLSDGSIIKMPYRVLSYEPVLSSNNINIVANTALEFRLKDINQIMDSDLKVDLREIYIEWMTPLGDFSLGKQIITWGSASENNPTDNISPYNYYYLFSMGKERKEGIFSLNSTFYYQNLKLNAIFIPEHSPNTLPLNDPEFALSVPIVPTDEQIMELDNSYEYGISINVPFSSLDITTSYFSGYDRIVSFFGANVWSNQAFTNTIADTVLSYRKTDVYGLGFSALLEDFTIRTDFGYFDTYDNIQNNNDLYREYELGEQEIIHDCRIYNTALPSWAVDTLDCINEPVVKEILKLNNSAKYYEYNFEIEYNPNSEFRLIMQRSKQHSIKFGKADSLTLSVDTILLDPSRL